MNKTMTLSERITYLLNKAIKEEKKLSQVELANRMQVAPASINKWMSGGSPSIDKLPQLCEILDITPNELFGVEPPELRKEAKELFEAFEKYPEYQNSIKKLLGIVMADIEANRD